MPDQYLLAIDQGTSSTKTVIFDPDGQIMAKASTPLVSYYPKPGFVEQNPEEIFQSMLQSVKLCLDQFPGNSDHIIGCGISNQRETVLLWNEKGEPLCNAVVWQCKRSVDICNRLQKAGTESVVRNRTGLILDPYFSGTKLIWLHENDDHCREAINTGKAYFGTVDTWLLFKLTVGKKYMTDYTNACRTLLYNIETLEWDDQLLEIFDLNKLHKPETVSSAYHFGESDFNGLLKRKIPISAMIGDSHAAAFGEGCFESGTAKATLGTGSSILLNTGQRVTSKKGMMTTICWSTHNRVDYALEGVIVTCGATIKWLQDQLGLIVDSSETGAMAKSIVDNGGVYLVPAFSGLGAPHWKMDLKAAILGLTFGSNKNHIVRAALESISYQIKDVIVAMESDSGTCLKELKVDGGITTNTFVMQFLTDLLQTDVINIGMAEVSALGAATLAGLKCGLYDNLKQLVHLHKNVERYQPGEGVSDVARWYQGWQDAVSYLVNQRINL